ncbi:hypothetical protein KCU92_g3707, partial [Aureobasidium melanogenum]|jgi:hypothetical protein
MNSSATFASGDERSLQNPFFSKLGNYFDRPDWWEEGAETLKAFFDGDTPHTDTTDQRLEDLLDLLEPSKVCAEPSRSSNAGVKLSGSAENTTDSSAFQQEQKYDLRHCGNQSIEPSSNDNQLRAEAVSLSNDLSSATNSVHFESVENGVAPAITKDTQDSQSHSEGLDLKNLLSIPDINTSSDAVNTSSPLFTGTTTSTRQTSPQPGSSTRASSILADPAVSFYPSLEKETIAPSPPEAPKLGSSARNATDDHSEDLPSELTKRNNNTALADSTAPVEDGVASAPFDHIHNGTFTEHSANSEGLTTVSENDPTGLQAVKDEISDENGLPKDIDSSILSQEDDDTVVHDPSAAATSFFPPNPYSDIPFGSGTVSEEEDVSIVHDPSAATSFFPPNPYSDVPFNDSFYAAPTSTASKKELSDENHEHIYDSSGDSTLTSLASGDEQMPEIQLVNQVKGREGYTPSPPPISPLTPPPPYFTDTTHANADVMGGVDPKKDGDTIPLATASTLNPPIARLGDVTLKQHAVDDKLQNNKGLDTANEVFDEPATKTSSDSLTLVAKRKQEHPHADEPAQKRRLAPITEDEHQPGINTETVLTSEEETIKSKSERPVRKGKNKATSRSAQRDSPDELAPTSPEELADSSALNPFSLNRELQKIGKTKLDRSTTSRSRTKKPVNSSAPLRKLVGFERDTRGGVGRRELAGLLAASPPRKAAEKEKLDVDGRLRSQSQTPAPASTSDTVTAAQTTIAAETIETNETSTPTQSKKNRLPGAHPMSAQELRDLGNTPILESRTRTRTATVEPAPESTTQDTAKLGPKRYKSAISNAEVERLGIVEVKESRTRNSTAEPTPVPTPAPTPAKRAKKPVAKPVAQISSKPSPFALVSKSKGTPKIKAPAKTKKKAAKLEQKQESPVGKQTKTMAKRKREEDGEEVEGGVTRASKRVAGGEPERQ